MKVEKKEKLRKIRFNYIRGMAKYNRGRGQFGVFLDFAQTSIIAGLGIELWNTHRTVDWWFIHFTLPEIPFSYLIPIMIFLALFWFSWGFLDQNILKITQAESEYHHQTLDPWLVKQFEDIKKAIEELKNK